MERANVVVIGGGIVGLSCARELRESGAGDVLVLEARPSCGEGSSARANGGIRAQWTTRVNVEFSLYSIAAIEKLAATYPDVLAFHQKGYLFFTADPDRAARLKAAQRIQREAGAQVAWLSPAEVKERAPLVDVDGVIAGTFHDRDGFLDPHSLVTAMKRAAEAAGARIRTSSPVEAIGRDEDGFVVTAAPGQVACEWVVNAAGSYAGSVAAMLGCDVPVKPYRRSLAFIHDPAPDHELIPMCVDLDTGVLVRREESGGFVISYSDPTDPQTWDTTFDPAWLGLLGERIGNRFPTLESMPLDPRHCWSGLYPETPDNQAVIGAFDDVPRFIQCGGFGGHGLMHSPAAGRAVAELVTAGACSTFSIRPYRPSRFEEGDLSVETGAL